MKFYTTTALCLMLFSISAAQSMNQKLVIPTKQELEAMILNEQKILKSLAPRTARQGKKIQKKLYLLDGASKFFSIGNEQFARIMYQQARAIKVKP